MGRPLNICDRAVLGAGAPAQIWAGHTPCVGSLPIHPLDLTLLFVPYLSTPRLFLSSVSKNHNDAQRTSPSTLGRRSTPPGLLR